MYLYIYNLYLFISRCHRAGVNSLQYDHNLKRLYSAGRDSIIRYASETKQIGRFSYLLLVMNLKDEDLIGSIETGFSVLHLSENL